MGPPGDGRNSVSSRYIRHFNVLYVEPFSEDSLKFIFATVMDWMYAANVNPVYEDGIKGMKDSIVANTIYIYKETMKRFRPTPAKSHYTFNLRDVSKIF
jgi:dynein heavy chain